MTALSNAEKTHENLVRRAADRQGFRLAKIRRRDPRALGYGRWLLTSRDGTLLIGDERSGATLEQVKAYLRGDQ